MRLQIVTDNLADRPDLNADLSVALIIYFLSVHALTTHTIKVQDTIAICPTALSQTVALAALTHPHAGHGWVKENVQTLKAGHDLVWENCKLLIQNSRMVRSFINIPSLVVFHSYFAFLRLLEWDLIVCSFCNLPTRFEGCWSAHLDLPTFWGAAAPCTSLRVCHHPASQRRRLKLLQQQLKRILRAFGMMEWWMTKR